MSFSRVVRAGILPLCVALAISCVTALLPVAGATADVEAEAPSASATETNAEVKVAPLRSGTLPLTIRALGRIDATRQTPARIASRVGGVVTEVLARDGGAVHPGEVLLRLDARAAEAAQRKAQSDLAVAERELDYAQKSGLNERQSELDLAAQQARVKATQDANESERLAALFEKKLVSNKAAMESRQLAETGRREADAAERKANNFRSAGRELDVERLRARVEEARSALGTATLDAEAKTVHAPVEARVTRVSVTVGQSVDPGAVLIEIEAHEGIGATFALPPARARQVQIAMTFSLNDHTAPRDWHGTIISVGAGVDEASGLVRVEGMLDPSDAPRPYFGQILNGEIVTGQSPPGLIAPESALSATDAGPVIHVLDSENVAHAIGVSVLGKNGGDVVVSGAGLKTGASVIVDGNYHLPDGAHVRPDK